MTFKYRYKKQIILGSIVLISLLVIGGFIGVKCFHKEESKKGTTSMKIAKKKTNSSFVKTDSIKTTKTNTKDESIFVDIKGEVAVPGTYEMKETDRVKDVIETAGGLTEKADTSVINLSKRLTDEMVIIIYSAYEVQNFKETKEREQAAFDACKYSESYGLANDACVENKESTQMDDSATTGSVNLNTASKEELMTLTGIGEAKADDIITYRTTNNGFKSIEEIKNVKGIGDSIFDKIKDRITI